MKKSTFVPNSQSIEFSPTYFSVLSVNIFLNIWSKVWSKDKAAIVELGVMGMLVAKQTWEKQYHVAYLYLINKVKRGPLFSVIVEVSVHFQGTISRGIVVVRGNLVRTQNEEKELNYAFHWRCIQDFPKGPFLWALSLYEQPIFMKSFYSFHTVSEFSSKNLLRQA